MWFAPSGLLLIVFEAFLDFSGVEAKSPHALIPKSWLKSEQKGVGPQQSAAHKMRQEAKSVILIVDDDVDFDLTGRKWSSWRVSLAAHSP
jgi:hypothetical protein